MDMKFLIYKAKTSFLTFLEDVLSEKNSPNFLGTPRVPIFEVVADQQYHSSRPKSEHFETPPSPRDGGGGGHFRNTAHILIAV